MSGPAASGGAGADRLGIFGGTFDPIHLGHLAIAEEARVRLGLRRVLFVPAASPPHKGGEAVAGAADRLAMVREAVAGNPAFAADDLELRRPGPSYTVDTVEQLAALHPGAELFYLLGSDSVVQLHTWHCPRRLYALTTLVALLRPGWPARDIQTWLADQPADARPRLITLEVPGLDIASRELRRRVASGLSIRYLVAEGVRGWIERRGLYGPPTP